MGNKSSSSSHMPPYLLGSGSGSRNFPNYGSHYYVAPFIAQSYGAPIFHQSVNSLQHFSGTDSGYMTGPADSERWRTNNWEIGNSRLSLNEAFFVDDSPERPSTIVPLPTIISIPPPTLKQFKKLQKRHKKMLKKMGSVSANLALPHALTTPLLQYSRAFSVENLSRQLLDGYADVPVGKKGICKERRKVAKCQTYGNSVPDLPPGIPKSSFNSGCSNGLAVSDSRMTHSAPSTDTSDRSHLTSTTGHSSLHHQTLSPIRLKNSSNRHLQRIQVSRSDARLGETPRRLQQWDFIAKGGPSAIVRYEIADVIGEEASSEVIKCETDHKSSDINNVSKKTAATNECNHSKAIIPHDYDERNYAYRSGIRGSINRNSQYSDCNTNNTGDINPQRNISVKITLEAEEVPEKNVYLFSKDVTNSTDNDKVFSIDEAALNSFQRYNCNVTSGTALQNQTVQQTQLGYFPLKKSADYGSTISSLTQSSNMKTEVSDIDFSWVNDVENRLEREIAFVREDSQQQIQQEQLPVQYFGVDFDQSKPGKDKAAVVLLPAYTVTTKSLEVFGECESRKELNQIHSDVRSKAAMFDTAFRNEQKAAHRYRSRSTPRGNVYIPQRDYRSYDPILVNISQDSSRYGIHSSNAPVLNGPKYDLCPQHYNVSY
ncbi:hypothetical protein QQG55_41140 [Brugia pahangi]|uniref:Non-specific serine/threonine protein kinase n=1 Tax=Brugia pahangi TaxID=6280 RepID=A0A0N4TN94_BRUPA|nr:unnamed protein product [Brugia pahangi]